MTPGYTAPYVGDPLQVPSTSPFMGSAPRRGKAAERISPRAYITRPQAAQGSEDLKA
jgi:hypothetical protein